MTADIHKKALNTAGSAPGRGVFTIDSDMGCISVRRLRLDELDSAWELTRAQVELSVAPAGIVHEILQRNPDSFWGVYRTSASAGQPILVGYYGFLLLNNRGAEALLDRSLDPRNPLLEHIAKAGEVPDAVYIWLMVVKGLSAIATPIVTKALGSTCAGRPLYASAGTPAGLNLMRKQGFHPVTPEDDRLGGLYLFGALGDIRVRPLRTRQSMSKVEVVTVSTTEELEKTRVIRAVFLIEQNCPYSEEFDGNDFAGTHLLGYVDGEPAATMRIRYFSNFVKLERLAVLPRFRGTPVAKEVVEAAVDLCRRKGYTKVYGHAQKRLVGFWSRFGFKPLQRNYPLVFSDHEYVEMWGELTPHDNPITLQSPPQIFLRPEGRWDSPCVLEASACRPATNPH